MDVPILSLDDARARLRVIAREAAASLRVTEWVSVEVEFNGVVCEVSVRPAAADPRQLDGPGVRGCAAAVVAVLKARGKSMQRHAIDNALKGHQRPGTVGHALRLLRKQKVVVNTRDKRGYRLTEWDKPGLFDAVRGNAHVNPQPGAA